MVLWLKAFAYYVVAATAGATCAVFLSILTVLPFASTDDNPGIALLWFMVLLGEATLVIPLALGITGEFLQRSLQARPFKWSRALGRFACGIHIAAGPFYFAVFVWPFRSDARPRYWSSIEVLTCGVSAVSAYYALRLSEASQRIA